MDSLFFHPKLVHLPMALGILMPLLSGGLLLAWWRGWLPSRGWWLAVVLQGVLVGSGALSLRTGEQEEERVEHIVGSAALEAHEEAAELFVSLSGGVLVLMLLGGALSRGRIGLPISGVATLGTIAVLALGYRTGEAGGALVYQHGAAQAYVGEDSSAPAATESAHGSKHEREADDD